MKTDLEWIDETPGVIVDDEHKKDLMELYKRIQSDSLREAAEIVASLIMHPQYETHNLACRQIRDAILAKVPKGAL